MSELIKPATSENLTGIKQIDNAAELPSAHKETEAIDLTKLQSDLKERMRILDKLVCEGHNSNDINMLRTDIAHTLTELDKILSDPDTDLMSEDIE